MVGAYVHHELKDDGKIDQSRSDPLVKFYRFDKADDVQAGVCFRIHTEDCGIVKDLHIAIDKPAPQENVKAEVVEPVKVEPKLQKSAIVDLIDAGVAVHRYLNALSSPPKPESASKPAPTVPLKKRKPVPPFDIQQIPDVMDKLNMKEGAALMRRWFAGEVNYAGAYGGRDAKYNAAHGIDHNGSLYLDSMVDTTTIPLQWALSYPRVQERLDALITAKLRTPLAVAQLKRALLPYARRSSISGLSDSGYSVRKLHDEFNFQHIDVDTGVWDKSILFKDVQLGNKTDAVLGALGGFTICAAIGYASIVNHYGTGGYLATIRSVYVYIKDSYDFIDTDESTSQYLGHWSSKGLYIAPMAAHGSMANYLFDKKWVEHPLLLKGKSIYDEGAVFYPVTNQDFRNWREKHQRGGDFLIFSNAREIKFAHQPIIVSLP